MIFQEVSLESLVRNPFYFIGLNHYATYFVQ
jgi:hypothetical protein